MRKMSYCLGSLHRTRDGSFAHNPLSITLEHMRYDGAKVIYIDSFNAETQCPESRPKYFFFIFSLSIGDHKTFKKSKYISRQYK